ncbi:thioesterase family protein [soil metagenome]
MNRVKIELPELMPFVTRIAICITDINYGNHAGNQVFLELLHEARVRYLQQFGYGELNLEGIGLIMADAAIEFKAEILYGDEVEVAIAATNISRVGFDLLYRVTALRQEAAVLAGKAKTAMICYDYDLKKVVALPDKVKSTLLGPA